MFTFFNQSLLLCTTIRVVTKQASSNYLLGLYVEHNMRLFFCPPPCVYITGHGWKVMQDHLKVCGYIVRSLTLMLSVSRQQMFACAKSLFISDQDKRKHFCLLRMIKVISKPSQKRQSMKNADLDDQCADQGGFVLSEGFICYGCVVQLVCTESGAALPPMVIRKVNKQHAILDVDEPVSQLHKCAFQFRDNPHAYLCLTNDAIIQYQAPFSVRDPSKVVLNDGSCWTIIGVEVVEFTFNQGLACITTPVSPFPVVTGLEVNGGGHVAMLEIHGENFTPHLKVWFGNGEAETMYKSPKSLLCVVPDVSVFSDGWRCLRRVITVPLSLVRLDGLIYRTSYSFTYTPELQPPPSARMTAGGKREGGMGGGQDDDILLETIHQEFTRANFHLFMQS
uniref:Recombination signal binding protein for immunoglobulin kappa J region-like n=1 Tax=Oreochromis aureus TaxID=47969 RepID=A0AAZ1X4M4_OREAU